MKLLSTIGATIGVDPLSGTPQITFGLVKGQSIPKSLEAIGSYLQESDKPVVICIDEFQQVVNYSEKDAEATFRTWTQNFPMIRFIFCGSHRRMMTSMFSEKSRPFYRSAQMRELLPLPRKAYATYINSHFRKAGKSIDSEHIESIFQWTRMQTYYVQLICNKLYGKTDHVDEETMKDVFSEIIQQEVPVFSSYQRLLTSTQWKLLVALAREEETENPYAHGFLLQHELAAASSVNAAMQTLIKKEFVIYHNNRYVLHDTLLMRWLQQL